MLSPCILLVLTILINKYICYNDYSKMASDDVIDLLPSVWPMPSFAQYSGYVRGETDNIQLHYWLVEAANNPKSAPLILWLNGGPGCSSMEGLLGENGPFNLVSGPRLDPNPYSWNKIANILYLESPAGVGFSYAVDGNLTASDDSTSLHNFHALLHFLEKFPQYKNRDFYITGESYAGVYIPTLALRVIESHVFNLKGIAVGNGLTNYELNDNSLLYFVNYHGLLDEFWWTKILAECCSNQPPDKCMFTRNSSYACQSLVYFASHTAINGLNIYNLLSPCAGGVKKFNIYNTENPYIHSDFGNLFRDNIFFQYQRNILSSLRNQPSTRIVLPCTDDTLIRDYLNTPLVQEAIHVNRSKLIEWDVCNEKINRNYIRTYKDMSAQYRQIMESQVPILIYNGDIDMACNYLGDDWFVDNLDLKLVSPRQSWLYRDTDGTNQIGGFWKVYTRNNTKLIYTTVRGAGHMVPQDKPIPSLHMIGKFISGQNL